MKFSPEVIEQLGFYVYLYINPLDNSIFYVGKGKGNRAYSHLNETKESRKVETIRKLRAKGKKPKIEILIHGLDKDTALRIETAVIDLLGTNLTNQKRGWESTVVGRMSDEDVVALYKKERAIIKEPVILLRINKLYRYGMSADELYEATRGAWKVGGKKRDKIKYAFAVFKGIIREVYKINSWDHAGTTKYTTRRLIKSDKRWEFQGKVANNTIRKKYINKSVEKYIPPTSRNPIKYVNC